MQIRIQCPHCKTMFKTDEKNAGKTGPCSRCGERFSANPQRASLPSLEPDTMSKSPAAGIARGVPVPPSFTTDAPQQLTVPEASQPAPPFTPKTVERPNELTLPSQAGAMAQRQPTAAGSTSQEHVAGKPEVKQPTPEDPTGPICYGLVVHVGDDGVCFIEHEQAPNGVFFHQNSVNEPVQKGDYAEFHVCDWKESPRPKALRVKLQGRVYGTVSEWRGTSGKILLQRASAPIAATSRDIVAWQKKKFFRVGEIVSLKLKLGPGSPAVAQLQKAYALQRFAVLGDETQMIRHLAEEALKERWEFQGSAPNQILWSYLFRTFERLEHEDEKASADNKKIRIAEDPQPRVASFDTGLVDKKYREPLYAVFEERPETPVGSPLWKIQGFCRRGAYLHGRNYMVEFDPLPKRAEYFDDPADVFYDSNRRLDAITNHIIEEREHRLPQKIRDMIPIGMTDIDQIRVELAGKLNIAIERAKNRILWNYKTAIPQYYPKVRGIQLLLPLCLADPHKVDLALVVQRVAKAYVGFTILELDWAYSNARLIARPDSDWLAVEALLATEVEDDEQGPLGCGNGGNQTGRQLEPTSEPGGDRFARDSIHTGRVTGIARSKKDREVFGVFVEFESGVKGVCPMWKYSEHETDAETLERSVKIGDRIRVAVIATTQLGLDLSRKDAIAAEGLNRVLEAEGTVDADAPSTAPFPTTSQ